jgi:hypothetical protein
MAVLAGLATLVLGEVISEGAVEAGEAVLDRLRGYWRDPGQALPKALGRAADQTWTLVELAVAGHSLDAGLRRALADGAVSGALAPSGPGASGSPSAAATPIWTRTW